VGLETRGSFRAVRTQVAAVLAAVGFAGAETLAPLVHCPGKALLLYVQQVAEVGPRLQRVQGPGSRAEGPGTRVQGPGSRVHRVQGPGSRV